jgi:hypothetical protein
MQLPEGVDYHLFMLYDEGKFPGGVYNLRNMGMIVMN